MNAAYRFVQIALHAWVLGFMVTALPMADALWVNAWSPTWVPPGAMVGVTHALGTWLPRSAAWALAGVVLVLGLWGLLGRLRWWGAVVLWWSYLNLMNCAWMAGSGGQQLMANLLLWNVFLLAGSRMEGGSPRLEGLGLWMMRAQLLLAYGVTALHKLTGTMWTTGQALGVVVGDEAFGPLALVQWPQLAQLLSWGVLGVQLLFPLLIWWRPIRPWVLGLGVLFHLATAVWLDIPEMGLAFVAAYSVWMPVDRTGQDRSAASC
jgi:hypothetical protein